MTQARDDIVAFVSRAAREAGFDADSSTHADDEAHDEYIRADTELALSRTGQDVGTPILTFRPGTDQRRASSVRSSPRRPTGVEAVELWDAVEKLATSPASPNSSDPIGSLPTSPDCGEG